MKITLPKALNFFTTSKTTDQSDGSTASAKDTNPNTNNEASSEQATVTGITNTPFSLVGHPAHGYFIALGKHRITPMQTSPKKALEQLDKNKWEIIINTIVNVVEQYNIMKGEQPKNSL